MFCGGGAYELCGDGCCTYGFGGGGCCGAYEFCGDGAYVFCGGGTYGFGCGGTYGFCGCMYGPDPDRPGYTSKAADGFDSIIKNMTVPANGIKYKKIQHQYRSMSCSRLTMNAIDGTMVATEYAARGISQKPAVMSFRSIMLT